MQTSFALDGRTALVTGASRGLGMAIAEGLAGAGADIIGVSANQPASGSEIQGRVEGAGRRFSGRACDFADRQQTRELVDWLDDQGHQVDILINNAGIIRRAPVVGHSDADWDAVLEVNLTAPFVLTRELAGRRSGMDRHKAGRQGHIGQTVVKPLHRVLVFETAFLM